MVKMMKNFFKKLLKRLKDYNFWISFSAGLVILLNAFGNAFGFSIKNQIVEDCVMAVAGMLVVFGIVNRNKDDEIDSNTNDEVEDNQDDSRE